MYAFVYKQETNNCIWGFYSAVLNSVYEVAACMVCPL